MPPLDQKGKFYLGQRLRQNGETFADELVLYDARDLTTHAVCVGMTGSGKTGLGIVLLEEAALDGIPALIIDPKGDMTNLLLAFPGLSPADFRPWIDVDSARRRSLSPDEYADEVARSWREGLARCGIDGTRIARLKQSVRFVVYTPGSDAGRPVSIVQSLHAPSLSWDRDAEALRETISGTVSAILALVDVESDPVTGREHNLLSTIIERSWRARQDMDLANLIVQTQNPPFDRLGILPLEVYFPEKERVSLSLALNGLLASPRFKVWLEGDPLRIDALLRTPDGLPQMSIFYLAHLSDSERLFFVTLLLEQVRTWLRTQEGTLDLRAILYIDELYGFMPPHPANPPTKAPLLALLKQARSQGMGLVLCTQNPIDLDYKGLSNAGTWFVGKLQTTNDRRRVLEGLDSASVEARVVLDKKALDGMIARLDTRTFLLNNVHAEGPTLFKTRHTMSYLRGPLTRSHIRQWMGQARQPVGAPVVPTSPAVTFPAQVAEPSQPVVTSPWQDFTSGPAVLPSGVDQYFVSARVSLEWAIRRAEEDRRAIVYRDRQLIYRAALMARAAVRIDNATHNVHERLVVSRVLPIAEDESFISWNVEPVAVSVDELDDHPAQGARFAPLPSLLGDARRLKSLRRDFADHVYRETEITLARHPVLKLTSRPGESESHFKRRCYQALQKKRDDEIRKLEKRYESKMDRLRARTRREERELEQDQTEHEARKREELISASESVLHLLTGRRQSRMLSAASRKRRLSLQSKADVQESKETIQDLEQQLLELMDELERERAEIQARWSEAADDLETVHVRPRKADVVVEAWGVIWLPYWGILFDEDGVERLLSLPAFEPGTSGPVPT